MSIKGLRKERDFMFCQYDIIEIALYLDDILEDKKEFIRKRFGEEYDYSSLLTKRSRYSTKDETADIDSIKEKLDSQDKADKIYRKKCIGYDLLYCQLKDYKFPTFYKYNDKNELHERKKTSRFSKSIHEIEETILKSGENYVKMKQKKEKMSIYSLEECVFFLVILLSPSTRNSIKWKGKKNKTKISYEKKDSEETLRFMEIVENTEKALGMILKFLPIIFEDPIFKDSTLQKKKREGKLNISKNDIDNYVNDYVSRYDIAEAVENLFELANLKNTIEIFGY